MKKFCVDLFEWSRRILTKIFDFSFKHKTKINA